MIEAQLSPVAPRVRVPWTGDVVPLADAIESLLRTGKPVSIQLDGENASEALRHLAAAMPDDLSSGRLFLEDKTLPLETGEPIVTVRTAHESVCDFVLRLIRWSQDDFIEYLLAKHPQQCRSVMARLKNANHRLGGGSPILWKIILDRMAGDETKSDIEAIVINELHARLATEGLAKAIGDRLIFPAARNEIGVFGHRGEGDSDDTNVLLSRSHSSVRQFLKHEDIRILFAMDRLVHRMQTADLKELTILLSGPAETGKWRQVAKRIAGQSEIESKLQLLFDKNRSHSTTHCATLLAFCRRDWRPRGQRLKLFRARFQNVAWPDIDLREADLRRASFAAADLRGARFQAADISGTDFSDANLSLADFGCLIDVPKISELQRDNSASRSKAIRKTKNAAKLKDYGRISFHLRTIFIDANLSGANLSACRFRAADFTRANLSNAIARHCEWDSVTCEEADLTGADFAGSTFQNIQLRNSKIDHCDFRGLRIIGQLNLENLVAEKVAFAGGKMSRSIWTGSRLTHCDFSSADLSGAKLAEINWENCDLRDVNFQGATFHMGSTRCGLVDSPYPSHGTRTGFYTDEYDEQYFKSPETIRKGSLVGSDLRGAHLLGVDFYLVDLRGAKIDEICREYLISSGAILDDGES